MPRILQNMILASVLLAACLPHPATGIDIVIWPTPDGEALREQFEIASRRAGRPSLHANTNHTTSERMSSSRYWRNDMSCSRFLFCCQRPVTCCMLYWAATGFGGLWRGLAAVSRTDWIGLRATGELPIRWGGPEKENMLWKSPLVGEGHASPIVSDGRVFVCTVHWPESVRDRTRSSRNTTCCAIPRRAASDCGM